ncbi:HIT family protein [Desulfobulbus alkaliphilus]|uniref:HIT family protein n=1 Tax=Desulfobulbus alkaliphilus TaxID=869814 RepID=UPI0019628731|nr:HIT domain-containing protein [Desulfobulbus alkaliphilus]MBM9537245.1 HIT domain-containing protein [Desulfobulbus alkaliphilus]
MKTLWTPWRMEHVLGRAPASEGCLFEPPGDTLHDKRSLLLFRDNLSVVLLNRFPYANGHLLLAPRRHLNDLTEASSEESHRLMELLAVCCTILRRKLNPHGINIGLNLGRAAGAGIVDHFHFHLVPRWEGDHNFMTVCAEIRTIPQHIDHTFDLLLPEFIELATNPDPCIPR